MNKIYYVDEDMMGSGWEDGKDGLIAFCKILNTELPADKVVPILHSYNGAPVSDNDIPDFEWGAALDRYYKQLKNGGL